jgi:hypothetical protein
MGLQGHETAGTSRLQLKTQEVWNSRRRMGLSMIVHSEQCERGSAMWNCRFWLLGCVEQKEGSFSSPATVHIFCCALWSWYSPLIPRGAGSLALRQQSPRADSNGC